MLSTEPSCYARPLTNFKVVATGNGSRNPLRDGTPEEQGYQSVHPVDIFVCAQRANEDVLAVWFGAQSCGQESPLDACHPRGSDTLLPELVHEQQGRL